MLKSIRPGLKPLGPGVSEFSRYHFAKVPWQVNSMLQNMCGDLGKRPIMQTCLQRNRNTHTGQEEPQAAQAMLRPGPAAQGTCHQTPGPGPAVQGACHQIREKPGFCLHRLQGAGNGLDALDPTGCALQTPHEVRRSPGKQNAEVILLPNTAPNSKNTHAARV